MTGPAAPEWAGAPLTLDAGGEARTYLLYAPPGLDPARPVPLVVVFHGGAGSARGAARQTRFADLAAAEGFVVAFPQGVARTWNAGTCCGGAEAAGVDDVSFAARLVEDVARRHPVDPERVYACGISNGGMMAYRLACELPAVAAVAAVAGTMTDGVEPTRPVPVLHVHGLADEFVPFLGGPGPRAGIVLQNNPVPGVLDQWVAANGCPPEAAVDGDGVVTTHRWAPGPAGADVVLVTIDDGGHAWPGGDRLGDHLDPPSPALDATRLIWSFFAARPRCPSGLPVASRP